MKPDSTKSFCSKVLLFGEYSIIQDSMGLAVPFPVYEGKLVFHKNYEQRYQEEEREFKAFRDYLAELRPQLEPIAHKDLKIDIEALDWDIQAGLHFESTIPQGFGLGSSGALCAAMYERYFSPKEEDISKLKKIFALMESHFHGKSSGLDPLISYLNAPLLIRPGDSPMIVQVPKLDSGPGAIFLLNTCRSRKTGPLVNLFLEKCKQESFRKQCEEKLRPITNACIEFFLEGDMPNCFQHFRELSQIQSECFMPMIPSLFQKVWDQGIAQGEYYLKLCGAGGGGFLLGITQDFERAQKVLMPHPVRAIFRF